MTPAMSLASARCARVFAPASASKVRVISTFDALVAIGNVNPSGKEKQIYPPAKDTVISVKAGTEIVLPLVADQYFQFTGETGTDQLVVTLVDPRALEGKPSKARGTPPRRRIRLELRAGSGAGHLSGDLAADRAVAPVNRRGQAAPG